MKSNTCPTVARPSKCPRGPLRPVVLVKMGTSSKMATAIKEEAPKEKEMRSTRIWKAATKIVKKSALASGSTIKGANQKKVIFAPSKEATDPMPAEEGNGDTLMEDAEAKAAAANVKAGNKAEKN